MDIELLGNRKVVISMPQHLQEALDFWRGNNRRCNQPSKQQVIHHI